MLEVLGLLAAGFLVYYINMPVDEVCRYFREVLLLAGALLLVAELIIGYGTLPIGLGRAVGLARTLTSYSCIFLSPPTLAF